MLRIKHLFAAVALAGLSAGSALTYAPPAQAGNDLCKNVSFEFTNSHSEGRSIKVEKVEYRDKGDGVWRTADVTDTECAINATCKTPGHDLIDMEQEKLPKVRFIFRYREKDGDWSDRVISAEKATATPNTCNANKTYAGFVIKGT